MSAVVITRDLMDGSRFRAAAPDVTIVRSLEGIDAAGVTVILVDLAAGVDLAAAVAVGPPVIAYGAHVDTEALAGARAAGCADALPRSQVFRRAGELLG